MKNQYFGDTRDLFKYDLLIALMRGVQKLEQITFIPMLTPDDSRRDGSKTDYSRARAGNRNTSLVQFMQETLRQNIRDLTAILPFFTSEGIRMHMAGEGVYFRHGSREDYFSRVQEEHLHQSLIFLDPDNGLEVKHSSEKHLLYTDVTSLCHRMGNSSILMIFQYIPRCERNAYLRQRCTELLEHTAMAPVWISDNQIVFFLLAGDDRMRAGVSSCIGDYADRYPAVTAGGIRLP